jgi:hypothetical protein
MTLHQLAATEGVLATVEAERDEARAALAAAEAQRDALAAALDRWTHTFGPECLSVNDLRLRCTAPPEDRVHDTSAVVLARRALSVEAGEQR